MSNPVTSVHVLYVLRPGLPVITMVSLCINYFSGDSSDMTHTDNGIRCAQN